MDQFKNIKVIGFATLSLTVLLLAPGISDYIRSHEMMASQLQQQQQKIASMTSQLTEDQKQFHVMSQQNHAITQQLQAVNQVNQNLIRKHVDDLLTFNATLAKVKRQAQQTKTCAASKVVSVPLAAHPQPSSASSQQQLDRLAHLDAWLMHPKATVFSIPQKPSVSTRASVPHKPYLQVGVFASEAHAQHLQKTLLAKGFHAHVLTIVSLDQPIRSKVIVTAPVGTSLDLLQQQLTQIAHVRSLQIHL